jgi:hypothetical protein
VRLHLKTDVSPRHVGTNERKQLETEKAKNVGFRTDIDFARPDLRTEGIGVIASPFRTTISVEAQLLGRIVHASRLVVCNVAEVQRLE